jgi:hypothetical protein
MPNSSLTAPHGGGLSWTRVARIRCKSTNLMLQRPESVDAGDHRHTGRIDFPS